MGVTKGARRGNVQAQPKTQSSRASMPLSNFKST